MCRGLPAHIVATLALVAGWAGTAQGAETLQVRSGAPVGEVQSLDQAAEVRVVFSKPMVTLGRIPEPVTVPFFRVEPAVKGTFRWAGTDTLVFTPDDPERLPWATRYRVTIAASAAAVDGSTLAEPYRFSFTTPTVRLLRTTWYREKGRFDAPLVVGLRFNQPVRPEAVAALVSMRLTPHEWQPPVLPTETREALRAADPAAEADFAAKVEKTRLVTESRDPVPAALARAWDHQRLPPGKDLVVLRTEGAPPTDGWVQVTVAAGLRGLQGPEASGKPQEYTIKLERTFFVDGFRCHTACDPDEYNPVNVRSRVRVGRFRAAARVADVTAAGKETPVKPGKAAADEPVEGGEDEEDYDRSSAITLEDAGYPMKPARTYQLTLARTLRAADGQTLGYTWVGRVENWHQRGFTSFGSGHGVWESKGGPLLPFYARNLQSVTQWAAPLAVDALVPTLKALQPESFKGAPAAAPTVRRLRGKVDEIQSFGIDLGPVLGAGGQGIVWAALKDGPPVARAHPTYSDPQPRSTIVQVTNLGLSVKDSPHGTLVFVTRLDDGQPVEGAKVAIRNLENAVLWSGPTDAQGIARAPGFDLRGSEWWQFRFVVTAEKDGDTAYVGSDWNDGLEPWSFDVNYDLDERKPLLRGAVFADRGVYRLGEEVHVKAILRSDTAAGIALLAGKPAAVVVKDGEGNDVHTRTLTLGEWSSADFAFSLPAQGPLGHYSVVAKVEGQEREVYGSFLVAAYRRPDFRVDANLAGESSLAGVTLKGVVTARYLFGSPMAGRDVRWTFSRAPEMWVAPPVTERFPPERWAFLDHEAEHPGGSETLLEKEATLDAQGQIVLDLPTDVANGIPYRYTVEGDVTDVSRQTIAGRASFRVDPAPGYVGLRRPGYFTDVAKGADTEVVVVDLKGQPLAGLPVKVTLTQVQWNSVRRAEGNGFYTWETERKESPKGEWTVTSAPTPVPLAVPVPEGGYYVLRASFSDEAGHHTQTAVTFYALGGGYTGWQRYDHNRIDLVAERSTYRPGDTAKILVKSPWEKATALVTTERESVRTHRQFVLSSTHETVSVPITEADVPNVYVSVLLVRGRTGDYAPDDASDPGKPAFRVGYVELKVEDAAKRLDVSLKTDREEYRPATRAKVDVAVKDHQGRTGPTEVTLWAVDYGVLSLTGHKTPDVRDSVWVAKALQVMNTDSRQNIISRRAIVPKGEEEGGGGGVDDGPGSGVRKDFRVLAFWLGSVVTDDKGRASTQVTLPESLTTYRVMAVAGDKASRFGSAEREIRVSKPVLLKAAFPRFLSVGDTALFGSVVHSQMKDRGTAIVTMRSLDPAVLEVVGEAKRTLEVAPKAASEVRFDVKAKSTGTARVQMTVKLHGESDAFEEVVPVRVLASPEVVAAYGQAAPGAEQAIELPKGVVPTLGGLRVETASTALVGLGEGARYLVDYPYGCAEQRASAALALMLAADLGDAFRLPGVEPARLTEVTRSTLAELETFQCPSGAYAFWKGHCSTATPYLTSWVLHVQQRGKALGHPVSAPVVEKALAYLEQQLGEKPPTNEGWWPAYTAWQAFATKVLAEGGRPVDSPLTRLYGYRERMPVFALAYLLDAMAAKKETGERVADLRRRVTNAILPEGGSAHVGELSDPYLLWFWNSNVRSTALVLGTFVRTGGDETLVPRLVRWLMAVRKNGRWGNTQENATAMEALVDYYKRFEADPPDFAAVVTLGLDTLARQEFRGRSTKAQTVEVPMKDLAARVPPGQAVPLKLERQGTGTLHYSARLTYASADPDLSAKDVGFKVERRYGPAEGDATTPLVAFKAGDLVKVTLTFHVPKERRYVAVTDPLPAGFEPVESWFATTARDLAADPADTETQGGDWESFWKRGGFDRVERHDDRVLLFATRLAPGTHVFSYMVRATTAGAYAVAPTHAEEMYEPEVFGRTSATRVEVRP